MSKSLTWNTCQLGALVLLTPTSVVPTKPHGLVKLPKTTKTLLCTKKSNWILTTLNHDHMYHVYMYWICIGNKQSWLWSNSHSNSCFHWAPLRCFVCVASDLTTIQGKQQQSKFANEEIYLGHKKQSGQAPSPTKLTYSSLGRKKVQIFTFSQHSLT